MADKWHGGKGSMYRKVDQKKFSDNWDTIFGNKDHINSTSDNEDVLDGKKENEEEERTSNT